MRGQPQEQNQISSDVLASSLPITGNNTSDSGSSAKYLISGQSGRPTSIIYHDNIHSLTSLPPSLPPTIDPDPSCHSGIDST